MWLSSDGRVKFDNEEDCIAYDDEQSRREIEWEEQKEEEEWLEEYYRRRRDPYWKNDSDYDWAAFPSKDWGNNDIGKC